MLFRFCSKPRIVDLKFCFIISIRTSGFSRRDFAACQFQLNRAGDVDAAAFIFTEIKLRAVSNVSFCVNSSVCDKDFTAGKFFSAQRCIPGIVAGSDGCAGIVVLTSADCGDGSAADFDFFCPSIRSAADACRVHAADCGDISTGDLDCTAFRLCCSPDSGGSCGNTAVAVGIVSGGFYGSAADDDGSHALVRSAVCTNSGSGVPAAATSCFEDSGAVSGDLKGASFRNSDSGSGKSGF